jgi:hypothetical protein
VSAPDSAAPGAAAKSTSRGPQRIEPGELVVMRNRKWNGEPHWVVPGDYLGEDRFGHWISQPTGSFVAKPAVAFYAASDALVMIPHDGHHVVTFFDELHPKKVEIYVDIVSDIRWQQLAAGSGYEVTLIDMDLDVIRTFDERGTWIDDEDEFAEHQVVMNYPDWAVSAAQSECNRIYSAVKDRVPPFDGTADDWFRKARP